MSRSAMRISIPHGCDPCAKPTVKATYMGASGKPYIKWNAVANASQYKVYRSTSKNGTYTLLGTTTATHLSLIHI